MGLTRKVDDYMNEHDLWDEAITFAMTKGDWAISGLVMTLMRLEIL